MNALRTLMARVRKTGVLRRERVRTVAMGVEREFAAWDVGEDTVIAEKGVAADATIRPSILVADKADLRRGAKGRVVTLSTGNHSVAAFPLLDGRFWKISHLNPARRSDVLMHRIVCANASGGKIELSQRDVPFKTLRSVDEWLVGVMGLPLDGVVIAERTDTALEYYRRHGLEWRVKPLAWTENEMRTALAASKKRISSTISYYHSARGVHFISFAEFRRFAMLSGSDSLAFEKALKELVGVYDGNGHSFTRMLKYRGHHEIEFFGGGRGMALEKLIPELEGLMESIALGKIGQLGVIQKAGEILSIYESLLTSPAMANENSPEFIRSLYMHITGEVYSVMGEGTTPAFDDRRTALPGATFVGGRPVFHPGADERSEVLLSNLRALMSKDELVEYANVYELRGDDAQKDTAPGAGKTREIVYKTNRSPVEQSQIEKRFSTAKKGYSSYMLARIEAFKALGIALSDYRVLRRRLQRARRTVDYFIRKRLEGESCDTIPAKYFCSTDDSTVEEKEVVLALATLMGDAAAQNLAMKKYDPEAKSALFGVGKEIYEFEYDIIAQRVVPKSVACCSVRGSFGWPSLDFTDENLAAIADFYFSAYASALKTYAAKHPSVTLREAAERFMGGFEFRTHALEWRLSVLRENFENFDPGLPRGFMFGKKWRFVLWSLERQERRLQALERIFFRKLEIE
ncbi:MAG: hypothetical protein IKD42_04105 [Kiritimatiellae bacterium]|nr:hypothetical protein [Kiritimatiellia bacterium]